MVGTGMVGIDMGTVERITETQGNSPLLLIHHHQLKDNNNKLENRISAAKQLGTSSTTTKYFFQTVNSPKVNFTELIGDSLQLHNWFSFFEATIHNIPALSDAQRIACFQISVIGKTKGLQSIVTAYLKQLDDV